MNCDKQISLYACQIMITRMPRILARRLILAAIVTAVGVLAACTSATTSSTMQATPKPSASSELPSYAQASRLRPCDSVSTAQLTSVIGKPVHIETSGDIGQKPVLSSGPVLHKVWIATCNWAIPAYPTTSLYLQVELTPSPAGARTDFDAMRAGMEIAQRPVHEKGYGQAVVFNADSHGNAAIIILQEAEIINFQFGSASQPAPPAEDRMRMAKAIASLIMRWYGGN